MTDSSFYGSYAGILALNLFFAHSVANTDLCKYVLWLSRVFFQFSADMGHIYPKDLVDIICIWSPDLCDNGFIGHDPAGILGKETYQLVFNLGKVDILIFDLYQTTFKVY